MDKIIGYFKITPYIFEIEILYEHIDNRVLTDQQKINATFTVIIFRVISIKHMVTHMLYHYMMNFEINKIYEELKSYYLTCDRAFNEKFIENKEYQLFPDGYTGIYNVYDEDGDILTTYYHKNGNIHGEALIYNKEGFVKIIYFYKKGKLKIKYNIDLDEVIRY
jgi:antitoxin component YwqK of YwqJK toxin-antitoxin module